MTTQAKFELALGLGLLASLAYGLRSCERAPVTPSGSTQMKQVAQQTTQLKAIQQRVTHQRRQTRQVTQTRRYDPQTGQLVSETTRVTEQQVERVQQQAQVVTQQTQASQTLVHQHQAEAAFTGLTAGVLGTPTGVGLTAGVTVFELAPVSLGAQAGLLLAPRLAPVAGLSLNGTVAPRLEVGVGVYLGPETRLGLTPVPGLPVSLQPGLSVQYRF